MSPRPSIGHHIASTAVGLFVFVLAFFVSTNVLQLLMHVSPPALQFIETFVPLILSVCAGIYAYLNNLRRTYRSFRLDPGWAPKYPEGHCQTCGYNSTGNTSGQCPECGEAT